MNMTTNKIGFSDKTGTYFKDYFHNYLSEVEGRTGFSYNTSVSLDEKEAIVNRLVLSDVSRLANMPLEMSGIDPVYMASNPTIRWATFAVVGSLVDAVLPDVADTTLGLYTDVRTGNYGDNFRFDIESNDLFLVSVAGRNQRTAEFQRQWAATTYVTPINHEITVQANMYRTLCGLDSIAKFVLKAALSVVTNVETEVYQAMNVAMNSLPTAPDAFHLTAAGGALDRTEAIKLVQRVGAYNGNAKPVFFGTQVALSQIVPAASDGYRFSDASIAYLPSIWGINMIEMRQVAAFNNKYKMKLDDDKIYVLSPGADKLVKLCYEGSTTTNIMNSSMSADKTETTTMEKAYGMAIATSAVAGIITLT